MISDVYASRPSRSMKYEGRARFSLFCVHNILRFLSAAIYFCRCRCARISKGRVNYKFVLVAENARKLGDFFGRKNEGQAQMNMYSELERRAVRREARVWKVQKSRPERSRARAKKLSRPRHPDAHMYNVCVVLIRDVSHLTISVVCICCCHR